MQIPSWGVWWFRIASLIVIWDASFVLLRPRSMEGGDLSFVFAPYKKYITVDLGYGIIDDGFVNGQAVLNIPEVLLSLYSTTAADKPHGVFWAFTAAILTLAKTVLYMAVEWGHNFAYVRHNDLFTLVTLFIIPNGLWIVIPLCIAWNTGKQILRVIGFGSTIASAAAIKSANSAANAAKQKGQ